MFSGVRAVNTTIFERRSSFSLELGGVSKLEGKTGVENTIEVDGIMELECLVELNE